MKKTILSILAASTAVLGFNSASAQDVSYSVGADYTTEYIFRGKELADAAIQPAIDVSVGDFYAGIWSSYATNSDDTAQNENDLYLGYNIALSEIASLDLGYNMYYYPNGSAGIVDDMGQDHSSEVKIGATFDVMLTPSLYLYYDWDLETLTVEGSIGYSLDLGAENTTLDLGAVLGTADVDDSQSMSGSYTYGQISATLNYAVSENGGFSAGVSYNGTDDTDSENIVGTVGVSASF